MSDKLHDLINAVGITEGTIAHEMLYNEIVTDLSPVIHADTKKIITDILADHDYNFGAGMRWHPTGEPTDRAKAVADRITSALDRVPVREGQPFHTAPLGVTFEKKN